MKNIFYLLLAILAYFSLSLGFVLQKRGIGFKNIKDKIIWTSGFIFMNLTPLINYFALKGLSASIVTATSGISVPLTIFLSKFILNSKIKFEDYLYSLLMMIAIFIANYFSDASPQINFNKIYLVFFTYFPMLLFIPLILYNKIRKTNEKKSPADNKIDLKKKLKLINTIIFAFCAGSLGGMMMIMLKIFQIENIFSSSKFFLNFYFISYIYLGLFSFISIQLAYKNGDILIVSPIQYGMNVFYPILSFYLIFNAKLIFFQLISFVFIIFFAVKMVLNHKELY
jgi:drug/metabolite transporter (DMT)-like permease